MCAGVNDRGLVRWAVVQPAQAIEVFTWLAQSACLSPGNCLISCIETRGRYAYFTSFLGVLSCD